MIKFIAAALWVSIATTGALLFAFQSSQQQEESAQDGEATPFKGLDYVKTGIISVPVFDKGRVHGYFLARLVYVAEGKRLAEPEAAGRGPALGLCLRPPLRQSRDRLHQPRQVRHRRLPRDRARRRQRAAGRGADPRDPRRAGGLSAQGRGRIELRSRAGGRNRRERRPLTPSRPVAMSPVERSSRRTQPEDRHAAEGRPQ